MLSELELLRQQVGELERKSESNGVDIIPDDEPWLGELLLDEGIDCEFFL
ncbi:22258_t:CDS:2 [Rhizophagus irregularis]|nr:22258_t:CDS:2 [Rhizophagus irregularis]